MTNSHDALFQPLEADISRFYRAVSQDSRYGHYVRIPERICRCLDYFNVSFDRRAVKERLHSYYLFIGVVDDAIDSTQLEAGREILKQLEHVERSFNEDTKRSPAKVVTEILKCHISLEIYPKVMAKLEELYEAVIRERTAGTMRAYIEQRKAIGHLTAELSYMLIRPLFKSEHKELRRFLGQVGEVGCLIDSVVDLRSDDRHGLLSFKPTLRDYLQLTARMLHDGSKIILGHPRLLGLYCEAVADDLLDQLRARRADPALDKLSGPKYRYAFRRAA